MNVYTSRPRKVYLSITDIYQILGLNLGAWSCGRLLISTVDFALTYGLQAYMISLSAN